MKKFIYFLIIILLLLVIAIETPIFLKYNQREKAIEILEKADNLTNVKITKKEVYNQIENLVYTIKYRIDIANIQENRGFTEWKGTTTDKSYVFWEETKVCIPSYDERDYLTENTTLSINREQIESLKDEKLVNLKFKNITYDEKDCLVIITENSNKIYDKKTGVCLKEYYEDSSYEIIYEYEFDNLTEEEMIPNFEGYLLYMEPISVDKYVKDVENDIYLPENFINDYINNREKIENDYQNRIKELENEKAIGDN